MNKIVGGSFLVQEADLNRIVTPEDFTEEQRMIAQLADDFVTNELEPLEEEMEHQLNVELTKEKLRTRVNWACSAQKYRSGMKASMWIKSARC